MSSKRVFKKVKFKTIDGASGSGFKKEFRPKKTKRRKYITITKQKECGGILCRRNSESFCEYCSNLISNSGRYMVNHGEQSGVSYMVKGNNRLVKAFRDGEVELLWKAIFNLGVS